MRVSDIIWCGAFLAICGCVGILTACEDGSKRRECEPVLQTGCSGRQTCGLQPDGTPSCFDVGPGGEGAACLVQDDCGADLGCLRVHGVARCLRFCSPGDDPQGACAGNPVADPHPNSDSAICLGTVINRADIGVCVLPCTPTDPQCPDQSGCGLIVEAGIAACRPLGEQGAGQQCDPGRLCDQGLGCVPHADRFVCRPFKTDACPEGTAELPVAGFIDQVNQTELVVCADCVALGRVGLEDEQISACPAPIAKADACASERGTLPALEDVVHAERLAASARAVGVADPWWTAATRVGIRWRWPDDTQISEALTPIGAGDCAVWNAGVHEARSCIGTTAAAICVLAPVDAPE